MSTDSIVTAAWHKHLGGLAHTDAVRASPDR